MSYFPSDIPYMSEKELLENGIKIPKIEPYLKPCPFCGGEAHIFQIQENSKLQSRLWVVRCPVCGANQLSFSEKHYAVEAWNRRVKE